MTTIHVTQEDIDAGIRLDCGACPVALAINRHLGISQPSRPYVALITHRIEIGFWRVYQGHTQFINQVIWWDNPAVTFVRAFDKSEPVKPFAFELDIPARLLNV